MGKQAGPPPSHVSFTLFFADRQWHCCTGDFTTRCVATHILVLAQLRNCRPAETWIRSWLFLPSLWM
ncbi:hypothetical protein RSOLAG1IB_06715 [Rhizoctonia solani AG-1 IB]|uniref:Uncharacterized protein n=1 Tax=Thanatephorus cucumeris (strain AG1-IB / isolate 7/3/14) TaxID=1108050 RepID=A0A0B7FCL7_THACB|nr:hypothetical protein RSOLAG1IB_06715 [Rhizoctonia solani AG-1 IB]